MCDCEDDDCDCDEEECEGCDMCRMTMVEFLAKQTEIIRKHGHSVIGTPDFSYTVGLSDKGLPEIICFGLDPMTSTIILNEAVKHLRAGAIKLDKPCPFCDFSNDFAAVFKKIPAELGVDYITIANQRAGHPVNLIQLVWPDRNGRFPWEKKFDRKIVGAQTLLWQKAN
jgi:hypothetical protein